MPDPPHVGLITRYLFESPYLPAGLLALAAVVVGWTSFREGRIRGQQVAVALGVLAVTIVITSVAVTTSGEHARRVTLAFVDSVIGGDATGAYAELAPNATLSIGQPTNPGLDVMTLQANIAEAIRNYPISDNTITMLESHATRDDEGIVHLACLTEVESGFGQAITSWVVRVRRQDDGSWKIAQITFVLLNGQPASGRYLR
jgi:hypothetical protein